MNKQNLSRSADRTRNETASAHAKQRPLEEGSAETSTREGTEVVMCLVRRVMSHFQMVYFEF